MNTMKTQRNVTYVHLNVKNSSILSGIFFTNSKSKRGLNTRPVTSLIPMLEGLNFGDSDSHKLFSLCNTLALRRKPRHCGITRSEQP